MKTEDVTSVRLLIADDHEVVRTGLVSLVEGTDVEVVGQAASGADAVALAGTLRPDVVLLDIRMPSGDGLSVLESIRVASPATKIIVLSTYDNPTYIARAQALGASEYLLKGCTREQILGAIHGVAAGHERLPYGELRRVQVAMLDRQKDSVDDEAVLTQRETQVLRHLALGLSNKEIGRSLKISVETVKEHVQHLLRKLNVNDRTQAAVWAVRKGLV
jgi:DNA-binding NarL/FixJ family response regulator